MTAELPTRSRPLAVSPPGAEHCRLRRHVARTGWAASERRRGARRGVRRPVLRARGIRLVRHCPHGPRRQRRALLHGLLEVPGHRVHLGLLRSLVEATIAAEAATPATLAGVPGGQDGQRPRRVPRTGSLRCRWRDVWAALTRPILGPRRSQRGRVRRHRRDVWAAAARSLPSARCSILGQ